MFIGFDYGTANCSVAVMRDGQPHLLKMENNSTLLPSMLCAPTREAVSEWLYRHHDVPTSDDETQALLRRAMRYNREEDIDVNANSVQFGLTSLGQYIEDPEEVYFVKSHLIPIITGATIVCFSFLGFDAVTTLSEETPDAARTIPKAIFLTALYGGLIFIAASFFMQLFFPDISRFKDPDAALPEIALYVGGKLFQSIFLCTTFVNTLASGLASHASVSRLLYVMGRDNVFPEKYFGYVHPKWRTPALNVIMVGIVALSALFFDLVTATALINFGALVAFTFVNLSVFNHFWRREGRKHTWQEKLHYLVLPMVGAATVAVLWVNLEVTSLTLGLVWAGVGLVYLAWLTGRFRKPPPQFDAAKSERAWE